MKQLEQILNAKDSKAERRHRKKGERGATRAEGRGQGKLKPYRNGDTIERVTKGSMANKKGHVAGCNENHMAVDHKSRQKKKDRGSRCDQSRWRPDTMTQNT